MIAINVNGKDLELSRDVSVRLNRVLFNPARLRYDDKEYSFSFDIPATPYNNNILGFGNALPSLNKFSRKLDCVIRANEVECFRGNLVIDSYDGSKDSYSCNAVRLDNVSLDTIFSSMTLNQVEWSMPYSGADSINIYNSGDTGVFFPFVSYGVFIKKPIFSDEVANDYTDRTIIDATNKFYYSTFYPSCNALELARKLFEKKGYDLVGTAFDDPILSNIYLSCHLEDGQIPVYNLAQPELGTVDMDITWTSQGNEGLEQSLSYPYFRVYNRESINHSGGRRPVGYGTNEEFFNWDTITRYNILGASNLNAKSYLYDAGEEVIVIPADGAYRIELEYDIQVSGTTTANTIAVEEKYFSGTSNNVDDIGESVSTVAVDIRESCPIEIQLVRNCQNNQNNIELIKGKKNKAYNGGLSSTSYREWLSCYPHEYLGGAINPTVGLSTSLASATVSNDVQYGTGVQAVQGRRPNGGGTTSSTGSGTVSGHRRPTTFKDTGYVYRDGEIMAYDTNVSPYFICGASSLSDGVNAVIRSGRSWYPGQASKVDSFYKNDGYIYIAGTSSGSSIEQTSYASNDYIGAPNSWVSVQGNRMRGKVVCAVWLNKDDILTLEMVHRAYSNDAEYVSSFNGSLKIDAFTPNTRKKAIYDGIGYSSESQFDRDLNIGNFLASDVEAKEYIEGLMNAFNLRLTIDGNTASLDTMDNASNDGALCVDIDDRAFWKDAVSERIDYPRTMAVKYQCDTDEYGYWETVPQEYVNENDWAEHGDKGYDVVDLDTVFSTTDDSVNLPFSFCWYVDFMRGNSVLRLPCISKYEYMAEGADYDEAMLNDGYGQAYRFWYRRPVQTSNPIYLTNGDAVYLAIPGDIMDGYDLSYHNRDKTLLKRYFSVPADISRDKCKINAYLTQSEYDILSDGGKVRFDDNIYKVIELQGYDPDNNNTTELSLTR